MNSKTPRSGRRSTLVLLVVGLWLLVVPPANAYIDPGSGSLILQAIVGAAVASALTIRLTWRRIRNFLSGLFSRET